MACCGGMLLWVLVLWRVAVVTAMTIPYTGDMGAEDGMSFRVEEYEREAEQVEQENEKFHLDTTKTSFDGGDSLSAESIEATRMTTKAAMFDVMRPLSLGATASSTRTILGGSIDPLTGVEQTLQDKIRDESKDAIDEFNPMSQLGQMSPDSKLQGMGNFKTSGKSQLMELSGNGGMSMGRGKGKIPGFNMNGGTPFGDVGSMQMPEMPKIGNTRKTQTMFETMPDGQVTDVISNRDVESDLGENNPFADSEFPGSGDSPFPDGLPSPNDFPIKILGMGPQGGSPALSGNGKIDFQGIPESMPFHQMKSHMPSNNGMKDQVKGMIGFPTFENTFNKAGDNFHKVQGWWNWMLGDQVNLQTTSRAGNAYRLTVR